MKKTNYEIKNKIKEKKIFYWQIANKLGIGESTLYRKFRIELSEYDRERIERAIDEIIKEEEHDSRC